MIFWMTNPSHGVMPAYGAGECDKLVTLGWALLNYGPSPDLPPKVKPAEVECKLVESLDPPVERRKPGRPAKVK